MTVSAEPISFIITLKNSLESRWLQALLEMCFPNSVVKNYSEDWIFSAPIPQGTVICTNDKGFKAVHDVLRERHLFYPLLLLSSNTRHCIRFKDQAPFTMEVIPSEMLSPGLLQLAVSSLLRDYRKEQQLRALAHFDPLTAAANRNLFNDRLKQAIKQAKRTIAPLSLLYFDLDKFKPVNDQYGHHIGDELLKLFTQKVHQSLREVDTLGRLGGDEFAVILTNTTLEQATKTAQRIIDSLAEPEVIDEHELNILTSIGILTCSSSNKLEGLSLERIMKEVDAITYQAKLEGKHSFVAREL